MYMRAELPPGGEVAVTVGGSFDSSFLPVCGLGSVSQTIWKDTPAPHPQEKLSRGLGKMSEGRRTPRMGEVAPPFVLQAPTHLQPFLQGSLCPPGRRQGHQQLQDQTPHSFQKQPQAVYQKPADGRSQGYGYECVGDYFLCRGDEITSKAISEKCLEGKMKAC